MKQRKKSPLQTTDLLGDGEKSLIERALSKKLRAALTRGWQSEADVVYFLSLLRKLMEGFSDPQQDYSITRTNFFCDWALHPVMTRSGAQLQLARFDEALTSAPEEFSALLENELKFEHFREDIIHQLIAHRLPTDPIRRLQSWIVFLWLYLAVVTDTPILGEKLNHIDRLQISVEEQTPEELPSDAAFVFTILWTFQKRRQVVLEWKNQLVCPVDPKPGAFYQLHGPRLRTT